MFYVPHLMRLVRSPQPCSKLANYVQYGCCRTTLVEARPFYRVYTLDYPNLIAFFLTTYGLTVVRRDLLNQNHLTGNMLLLIPSLVAFFLTMYGLTVVRKDLLNQNHLTGNMLLLIPSLVAFLLTTYYLTLMRKDLLEQNHFTGNISFHTPSCNS